MNTSEQKARPDTRFEPGLILTSTKMLKALQANPEFRRLGLKFVAMKLIKEDRAQAARIWESQ